MTVQRPVFPGISQRPDENKFPKSVQFLPLLPFTLLSAAFVFRWVEMLGIGRTGRNTRCWSCVRLQNLPWYKTGLVSRQVLHLLSKLQNWIWSKTGRYKTGLVSNAQIEASIRATKPKPWQSHLTSDTVEIFMQNEKAGLVPMQSRLRSRHKASFGAAGLGTAQSWFWSRHKASFGAVSRPV